MINNDFEVVEFECWDLSNNLVSQVHIVRVAVFGVFAYDHFLDVSS